MRGSSSWTSTKWIVDERRWKHVTSKDNLHVRTERNRKELMRVGGSQVIPEESLGATQRLNGESPSSTRNRTRIFR
jgi:hypothetical protein